MNMPLHVLRVGLLPALLLFTTHITYAGSAKWKASPATGDWNTALNWTVGGPPNGSSDTATFRTSSITSVATSSATEVNSIVFAPGASAFTITSSPTSKDVALTVSGAGITNNSGIIQNFVCAVDDVTGFRAQIFLSGTATAGTSTVYTTEGFTAATGTTAGRIWLLNSSTAENATFINNGANGTSAEGGTTILWDTATASNATFINNGNSTSDATQAGVTHVSVSATADNATFINNGAMVSGAAGGTTEVASDTNATAGNATFINNPGAVSGAGGGSTFIDGSALGGTCRIEVFGNGFLDISLHYAPRITIGSIEGDGNAFLGGTNLTVGSSNLSTTFSGVMQDGGFGGGTLASFTKIGTGTLTLSGANTYTGGTTVNEGTLLVTTRSGSGTGTGAVQVNAGTLGGTGRITGAVTMGTGSGSGSFLSPGVASSSPGKLTMSKVTFNADSTYQYGLKTSNSTADQVIAKGVTIITGAQFSFTSFGSTALASGTVFTAINNTAATPISGTFANLPDGSTFTSGPNTYKANYEGGTGNDLTLTVQ